MKTTTKLLVSGLIIIILVAFSVFLFNHDQLTPKNPEGKTVYYTMIVNDDIKSNSQKRYEYTLDAYNEKGEKEPLTFTSSKQLREGAYLELYVASFRGVTYWQEIQLNDLPDQVKDIYSK
ncbi:YxeA family protein [Pseudogracilibacillus sp. SO30301A]|uniref:YxeA family protein n=1 Tax=Pseudogracilibacillus sp. SO30301A TaxID=3098291 RepID=UPI00300E585C